MTINEAIMVADEMRPNVYDEEQKTKWLEELDGKISQEVMELKSVPEYEYSRDGDKKLLVNRPHEDIYPLYLVAMIDFHNNESEFMANSLNMFNRRYEIFAKWYIRNHTPKSSGGYRNGI